MPLDFPNSPTNGQTYTGPNNVMWQWDGTKWVAGFGTAAAYAPVNSPQFTGDPQAPTPSGSDADSSIATTAFVAPAWRNVGRNLVHNGQFNIAQRGDGPFTSGYHLDRWACSSSGDTISISRIGMVDSDRATIGDESARYYLRNQFTGTAGASAYNSTTHWIEDVRRLGGKTVTVSFWAGCAAGALKLGVSFYQFFAQGSGGSAIVSVPGQSVTLTNNWVRYSLTFNIPSTAGKTIGTAGGDCTGLNFWFSAGSSNASDSGSVGVQSGIVYMWGVQLEIGNAATPLEKRDPQVELAMCQRFYQFHPLVYVAGYAPAANNVLATIAYPVTMRATPTGVITAGGSANTGALSLYAVGPMEMVVAASITATGWGYSSATIALSADL